MWLRGDGGEGLGLAAPRCLRVWTESVLGRGPAGECCSEEEEEERWAGGTPRAAGVGGSGVVHAETLGGGCGGEGRGFSGA